MATTAHQSSGEGVPPRGDPGTPRVGGQASLTALAATILRSARDLVAQTFEIAALESRLAGIALVAMAGIAIGVMILVLSVWGLLLAAAVYGLMQTGLGPGAALLLAGAVNLAAAGVLILIFLRLMRYLKFSATRRALEKMTSNS